MRPMEFCWMLWNYVYVHIKMLQSRRLRQCSAFGKSHFDWDQCDWHYHNYSFPAYQQLDILMQNTQIEEKAEGHRESEDKTKGRGWGRQRKEDCRHKERKRRRERDRERESDRQREREARCFHSNMLSPTWQSSSIRCIMFQ